MSDQDAALRAILARARLLALDVDGTLTDARVLYVGDAEAQAFCIRDGQGMVWLREAGVELAWISGRGCEATRQRARDVGVTELHLRVGPKAEVLRGVQERLGIAPDETLAMGDDLPDLGLAARAALLACPADAVAGVRERAGFVCASRAGDGAVRELAEAVLDAKGLTASIAARYAPAE